jgi:uncharacterized alkaline shock family protein YloU
MALADGVAETIISIAVQDVDGVASIGGSSQSGLSSFFATKPPTQGIDVQANDDDTLTVALRIEVYYGYVLPEVADQVRSAVSNAVLSQIGLRVGSVDVYIDGIRFVG